MPDDGTPTTDNPRPRDPRPRDDLAYFAHKALVASAIGAAVVSVFLFVWYSVYVLFLLFAGVLVAILLRALAELVTRCTALPHRASLAVVLVVLVAMIGGFWWFAASSLSARRAGPHAGRG